MSLIEKLRDESCRQDVWANDGESTVVGSGPELLMQAADEIEQLTDERLCRCADEVRCEMKAEIERLRAALNQYRNAGIPATVYERNKELLRDIVKQQAEIERLEGDANSLCNTITSIQLSLKERDAEIERLRTDLELDKYAIGHYKDEIAKLLAVVDAAKVYTDSDWNNMVRVDRNFDDLCKAIAALGADDE